MTKPRDVTVGKLNRIPIRKLPGKCLKDGLEVRIQDGRIVGYVKSPPMG